MIRKILFLGCMIVSPLLWAGMAIFDQKRMQVGFGEKVEGYVQRVRNARKNLEEFGEIFEKAALLMPYSSMKRVATILNYLEPFLIQDKDDAQQDAFYASLIKTVVPIVKQFEKELFKNLHKIDRCLEYWEYQQMRPVSYFFHKSPLKHFTLGQREEVIQKIQFLKEEQQRDFALVGKIGVHLSAFDARQSVADKHAWMQRLCIIIFSYDLAVHVSSNVELFPLLYQATSAIDSYRKYAHRRLSQYCIPSVFVRNWLRVTGAVVGLAYLGSYVKKHKEEFVRLAKEQTANIKTVIFGSPSDGGKVNKEFQSYKEKFDQIGSERLKEAGFEELSQIIDKDENEERSRFVREMFWYYLHGGVEGVRDVGAALNALGQELRKENGGVLAEVWSGTILNVKKKAGDAMTALSSGKDDKNTEGVSEPKMIDGFVDAFHTSHLYSDLLKEEHPRLWAMFRSSPFSIALCIASWSTYKLYRRIYGTPCYDAIRAAMIDIALLLNVYGDARPEDMNVCDFGRLAYLVYKLQLEEWRLPKQHRSSFSDEIGLLQTSSLTADQKMKVIDLLFKKYPFLAGQGLLVA